MGIAHGSYLIASFLFLLKCNRLFQLSPERSNFNRYQCASYSLRRAPRVGRGYWVFCLNSKLSFVSLGAAEATAHVSLGIGPIAYFHAHWPLIHPLVRIFAETSQSYRRLN